MTTKTKVARFDPGSDAWTPRRMGLIRKALAAHMDYLVSADASKAEREAKRARNRLLRRLDASGRRILGVTLASLGAMAPP